MRTTFPTEGPAPARPGRLRAAWRAAHRPADGVSRRMRLIAYAVPLAVLPSGVWRFPAAFSHGVPPGEWAYLVCLSVVSEVLAFTAVGLVARWGEVFPGWVPFLRGRPVPVKAAVVPAAAGAVLLTLLWTVAVPVTEVMDVTIRGGEVPSDYPGRAGGWEAALFYLCYAPLVLWGPLLGVLTVAYARRRRTAPRS
ncbi:hypothetical protein [Streptomyces sudanensis]|uniref:hypothetical protein n=1 Tax=Streptomyces sudanensis TaxID=436397 RepID=UPI0020CF41EB|nr:hypothetical protein [Streptomyces sudanensis]MCP9957894.1 hypothetical protein [Streptomyces sudanensis]MCP9987023.1 hypothetical protein [Streptomyces sudanensis]MCQ0001573.1 hypothetical protein [Streptomyces sudanensis]